MQRRSSTPAPIAGALAAWLALAGPALAQIACPADLSVDQRTNAPSNEWTVGTTGYRPLLSGVTIYEGPPEKHVSLKPQREQTVKDETTQAWELPAGRDTYWLSCEYTNTNLVISRPLPRDIRRCEAVRTRGVTSGDGRPPVKSVACRGDPATRSREGASIHRGTVVLREREQVFVPCGAKTRYWVVDQTPDGDLESIYRKLAPQGQPLFIDVHGWIGPATEAAAAAKLEQAITVSEVRRAIPGAPPCGEDLSRFEVGATGGEPPWTLEVSRETLRFRPENGEEQVFPYAKPQPAGGGLLYAAKAEGPPARAIGVVVRRERCIDPRTGAVYSLSAEVGVGGEKLKGCAYAGEAARQATTQRAATPAPATTATAADASSAAATPKSEPTKNTSTQKPKKKPAGAATAKP